MSFQMYDQVVTIIIANVRKEPSGTKISALQPGERLAIVGGPVNKDGLTWWEITGAWAGWVAEEAPNRAIILDKYDPTPFGRSMAFVLGQEGGYVDDPNDSGGATLWGIASRFNPDIDLSTMTLEQAKQIYHDRYWIPSGACNLEWPYCLTVFDFAVNAGVNAAIQTRNAAPDFHAYNEARRAFYRGLHQFSRFGAGWLNRVNDCEREGERS